MLPVEKSNLESRELTNSNNSENLEMLHPVNPSLESSESLPSGNSEGVDLLQAVNPSLDTLPILSSLPNVGEAEMAERIEALIEPMSEMFVKYFLPKEIAKKLTNIDDDVKQKIFNESLCDSERGMHSLLERLVEIGGRCVVEFYELISTMDADSSLLPMTLLSGKGIMYHEEISGLMQFVIELVEQKNIEKLTNTDMKAIVDFMMKEDLMKKPRKSIESMKTPVEGFMYLLTLVRKSNPDWPSSLWSMLKERRQDLFFSEAQENTNALPTESWESLNSSFSSGLSEVNPSESSFQSSDESSSLKTSKSKMKRHRHLQQLHVKPKNLLGIEMLLESLALNKDQVTSEEGDENTSVKQVWNPTQDSYLSDEDEETDRKVLLSDSSDSYVDLQLREYQKELAKAALKGSNTIICAPTGSGKTRVALDIIIRHLKGAKKPPNRVCFFARTVPLAVQQYKNISKYLPKEYKINLFTGDSEYSTDMHLLLPDLHVIVLTPMILQNHIARGNLEGLSVFSLLIFDECHHTREGEPYNTLMASYVDKKLKGERKLPQVVGLTASFPVEKANNDSTAAESVLQLCANMDAHMISVVVDNKVELEKNVPVPIESIHYLHERDDDESFKQIIGVMERLEEEANDCAQDIGNEKINSLVNSIPSDNRKMQKYGNWAVDLLTNAVELPRSSRETNMSVRLLMIIAEYLFKYHFALETHDLVHLHDVIDYLEVLFAKFQYDEVQLSASGETRLYDYFKELKNSMQNLCHKDNPNLIHLMGVIDEKLLKAGSSSRGIIFVRTRAIAEALVSWLLRCNNKEIRDLKANIFTGTNAKEAQGGMTQSQQNALVEKFREGKVRLLVATSVAEEGIDVPECNLVIKYNHVGNEITTIQSRGRSRKEGGHSVLLAMTKICEKEILNQKRTELMYNGIEIVRKMPGEEFVDKVVRLQIKASEKREIDTLIALENEKKYKNKKFKVICKLCRKFYVESDNIRIVCGNFRIVVDRDVWDHKKINLAEPKYISEAQIVGSVRCRSEVEDGTKCNGPLGALVVYNSLYFLALGIKNYIVEEDGASKPKAVKKWKDLPYPVKDLSTEDIKNYLQQKKLMASGIQETGSADVSHMSSFAATVASESIGFDTCNEIFRRYDVGELQSIFSLSTNKSSSSHHET